MSGEQQPIIKEDADPAAASDGKTEDAAAPQEGAANAPAVDASAQEDGGPADAHQQQQQRPLQHTFEAIKLGSQRLASLIKHSAERITAPAAQPHEQEQAAEATASANATMAKIRATATGLGALARQTSSRLVHTATESFKRFTVGDPLLALCRSEPHVPQLVLACCTALVVGEGVKTEGIFKEVAPVDEVERMSALVAGGRPALIPPGTSPHVVAALLKRFLLGLQEPLLTYTLLPDWISVAGDLGQVKSVLVLMPATSANVLRLLLEVCHYVNTNSAVTEMDALALAEVLAPCVAWLPPGFKAPKAAAPPAAPATVPEDAAVTATGEEAVAAAAATSAPAAPATGAPAAPAAGVDNAHKIVPLEGDEAQAIVLVLEALINRFPQL